MDEMTPFKNTKFLVDDACDCLREIMNGSPDADEALDAANQLLLHAIWQLHDAGFNAVEVDGEDNPDSGLLPRVKDAAYRPEAVEAKRELRSVAAPVFRLFSSDAIPSATDVTDGMIQSLERFLPGRYQDALNREQEYLDARPESCF